MMKLVVAFRNFANAPKKGFNVKLHVHSLLCALIREYNCVRQTEKEQGERGCEPFQTIIPEFAQNTETDHEIGHLWHTSYVP